MKEAGPPQQLTTPLDARSCCRAGDCLQREQDGFEEWERFFPGELLPAAHTRCQDSQGQLRAGKHLNAAFGSGKLVDLTADEIEWYLLSVRERLRVKTAARTIEP